MHRLLFSLHRSTIMKKHLINLVSFLLLLQTVCESHEIDYSSFRTVEEVIEYETFQIENADYNNFDMLSDTYTSRGESYLLCGKMNLALIDLERGYKYAQCSISAEKSTLLLRSLFDLAIVYGIMDKSDEACAALDSMKLILESYKCECSDNRSWTQALAVKTLADQPILGPDKISVKECIDRANITASYANDLIKFVKRPEVQILLDRGIEDLRIRAI